MSKVIYVKYYDRPLIRSFPDTLFVFGDNMARRGYGGQAAVARGEPNAVGIPTKWVPTSAPEAFFSDNDFTKVIPTIDAEFLRLTLHPGKVVWPADGIGTGLAQLVSRAPQIFYYIEKKRLELEIYG